MYNTIHLTAYYEQQNSNWWKTLPKILDHFKNIKILLVSDRYGVVLILSHCLFFFFTYYFGRIFS